MHENIFPLPDGSRLEIRGRFLLRILESGEIENKREFPENQDMQFAMNKIGKDLAKFQKSIRRIK